MAARMNDEELLFYINAGWVQEEAMRYVQRRLTRSELHSVKKGLEWGLTTSIDVIFKTAITEAVEETKAERRRKRVEKELARRK